MLNDMNRDEMHSDSELHLAHQLEARDKGEDFRDDEMWLPEAMLVMSRPFGRAERVRDTICVSLFPFGAMAGGTSMVVGLDRDAAMSLLHQLEAAIKLNTEN